MITEATVNSHIPLAPKRPGVKRAYAHPPMNIPAITLSRRDVGLNANIIIEMRAFYPPSATF